MKKILLALFFVFFVSTSVFANQIYSDNYYGTFGDNDYVNVSLGQQVTFDFSLLNQGYDPLSQTVTSANLSFDIWSEDPQDETLTFLAGFYDGATLLAQLEIDLGGWWIFNDAATTTYDIDLATAGLLNYLQDGQFTSIVLALQESILDWDNDFRIEGATLTADATAPVPEPATLLLLGSGLAGLAFYRRKRK
jgi:hypothetical protein